MILKKLKAKPVIYSLFTLSLLVFAGGKVVASDLDIDFSGYLIPESVTKYVSPGETVSIERAVTLQVEDLIEKIEVKKVPEKLDVLFLADNTDSMTAAIENVQDNASDLLSNLSGSYSDLQIGVAKYYGDPSEKSFKYLPTGKTKKVSVKFKYLGKTKECVNGQGVPTGKTCYQYQVKKTIDGEERNYKTWSAKWKGEKFETEYTTAAKEVVKEPIGADAAYDLMQPLSGNLSSVKDAIDQWSAGSGGNWKEGGYFALHQAATDGAEIKGFATNDVTGWRDDSKKIIVWFGDAQSHTSTANKNAVIKALDDKGVCVVAIHVNSTDKSYTKGLNAEDQATNIINNLCGAYSSVFSSDLSEEILSLIDTTAVQEETKIVSPGLDLYFESQGNTQGLNVEYVCSDPKGCNDVKSGETRSFTTNITLEDNGLENIGSYKFDTVVNGKIRGSNEIFSLFPD